MTYTQKTRRAAVASAGVASVLLLSGWAAPMAGRPAQAPAVQAAASQAEACTAGQPPESPELRPTTPETLEQVYRCILVNSYAGPAMDHRDLLAAAFAAFTQELHRRGMDQADVTTPPMSGDRDRDWQSFIDVYKRVEADGDVQQALAAAVVNGMVASLDDNHARWVRPEPGEDGPHGLGIAVSGARRTNLDPAATEPLFVTEVIENGPAAKSGVRPGDVIVSVDGAPPFLGGTLSEGVINRLSATDGEPVRLRLRDPESGSERTVSVEFGPLDPPPLKASGKLVDGDVAYVGLPGFYRGSADDTLAEVERLRADKELRGLVLDLRGNIGGGGDEVARLLGAFAHGKITSYQCDVHDKCTATRTDDSVPLLGLPLVVLVDRASVSAGDDFSAAVKGLGIAPLVGTRTAGFVAGSAMTYPLNDGSVLAMPSLHHRGPHGELVNTVGVPADHQAPMTPRDLSAGRDPALAKALTLLK
ncbi:PDZ domain-containing protein [Nonomuraea mesophila]|uniref:PDZ domain-containing protein n=1 Tax=Nonomuraea mesophila TaxID=2530382 RepID=A0A4V6PGH9_9ACTN|nr:S41 family peptidase [Nonomuraea mesophila]TDE52799.1 PDZ domain-containing protein [Nonomuraea mesophila]